jgi:hypothetical protein
MDVLRHLASQSIPSFAERRRRLRYVPAWDERSLRRGLHRVIWIDKGSQYWPSQGYQRWWPRFGAVARK